MADTMNMGAGMRALEPLAGHYASGFGVSIAPIPARPCLSLRAHPDAVGPVGGALGLALPTKPKTSVSENGLSALWLGPQDWLIVGEGSEARSSAGMIAALEASGTPDHSAVDVSHRFVGIAVEGPAAEAVLAAGCPQDLRLRTFPVGAASRSILSKADIVLWRRGETGFELLCARSFADYVWAFLVEAARAPAV